MALIVWDKRDVATDVQAVLFRLTPVVLPIGKVVVGIIDSAGSDGHHHNGCAGGEYPPYVLCESSLSLVAEESEEPSKGLADAVPHDGEEQLGRNVFHGSVMVLCCYVVNDEYLPNAQREWNMG